MDRFNTAIEGLTALIHAAADAEFGTVMGLVNFALILVVFLGYMSGLATGRLWYLAMWVLDRCWGPAPDPPRTPAPMPSLTKLLQDTVGFFLFCVVTVSISASVLSLSV